MLKVLHDEGRPQAPILVPCAMDARTLRPALRERRTRRRPSVSMPLPMTNCRRSPRCSRLWSLRRSSRDLFGSNECLHMPLRSGPAPVSPACRRPVTVHRIDGALVLFRAVFPFGTAECRIYRQRWQTSAGIRRRLSHRGMIADLRTACRRMAWRVHWAKREPAWLDGRVPARRRYLEPATALYGSSMPHRPKVAMPQSV